MKYIVSIILAFSVLLGVAVAGDCAELPDDPFDPFGLELFIRLHHTGPVMADCCCYTNDFTLLMDERNIIDGYCCNTQNSLLKPIRL